MKTIIAGGRQYNWGELDILFIDQIHEQIGITEVFSGHCPTGADELGEWWAVEEDIQVRLFPADWKRHGKAAGPIRNEAMAMQADAVILFPGGRGTASMKRLAKIYGLRIFEYPGKEAMQQIVEPTS